jgi:hypothetical protein
MKRLFLVVLVVLSAAIRAEASNDYRTYEFESLKVAIDSEWGMRAAPGYFPIRFDITNYGNDRVIDLVGLGQRYGGPASFTGFQTIEIRQRLHLKRGDRLKFTVPVPTVAFNENIRFQILEDGRVLQLFNYLNIQSGVSPDDAPVLIIADSGSPVGAVAESLVRSPSAAGGARFSPGGVGTYAGSFVTPKWDFVLEPARIPTNWLGFTSLRAVVLGTDEWQRLSEAQRDALLTWAACGGDLIFLDGNLKTLFATTHPRPIADSEDSGTPKHYFLGHLYFPKTADVNQKGLDATISMTTLPQPDSNSALPANREFNWGAMVARGFRLPIPGVEGVPARAFFWILIVFTVLIGPANYLLLWRRRQQVLLVLTVPLISALFIAILAGYALAGEGFGVRGRAETFSILDQATNRAAIRSNVSLYAAGITPSGGLRFPRDVAIFPLGLDGRGPRENESVDLTDLQQYPSGLLQARTPSNFETVQFRSVRERVSFSREGNQINVTNGLGVKISHFFFRSNGALYTLSAETLNAGEKAPLIKDSKKQTLLDGLAKSDPNRFSKLQQTLDRQTDGSYVAVLEHSPFWESGVAHLDERGSLHLLLGYVERGFVDKEDLEPNSPPKLGGVPSAARRGGSPTELLQQRGLGTTPPAR